MKSKKLIAFLSAVTMLGSAFCTLPAMAEAGTDLINNGTMEGADGNNIPHFAHTTNAVIERSDAQVHSGNYSVKIHDRTGVGKDNGFLGQYFTAPTVGKTYTVTAYIYATETDTFTIAPLNNYSTIAGGFVSEVCQAKQWTELTGNITINEWAQGDIKIWSDNSTADFYVDDWSMIEQPDTPYVNGQIVDGYSLSLALKNGGNYTVMKDYETMIRSSIVSEATQKDTVIDAAGKRIQYPLPETSPIPKTAMINIEEATAAPSETPLIDPNVEIKNAVFAGSGTFVINNAGKSTVTISNTTFENSAVVNNDAVAGNGAIINHSGTVILDNVVFPARTDGGSDVLVEWGGGQNYFKGSIKANIKKTCPWGDLYVQDLAPGADLTITLAYDGDGDRDRASEVSRLQQSIEGNADIEFSSTEDVEAKTTTVHIKYKDPVFSGNVTGVKTASGTGDYSSTVATAFETLITNAGGKATVKSIKWDIQSGDTSGSTTETPQTQITLENGGEVTVALIVNGLNDASAKPTVTVE